MKPVIIIAIAVVCSVVAVLVILVGLQAINTHQFQTVESEKSLFVVTTHPDDYLYNDSEGTRYSRYLVYPNPDNQKIYDSLMPDEKTVVIVPLYTMMAYAGGGFYDYYNKTCDESCLTVEAKDIFLKTKYNYRSSASANQVFMILGYDRITDEDLNQDLTILSKYDKVIMLHNEYVTMEMFDAITSHPKVIYLYPNALYAEITVDYQTNSITLVRGHGYPEDSIQNGFDWKNENTHPYEYDAVCEDWNFYKIDQGYMLNCYPENRIVDDIELLKTIRDL